MTLFELQDVAAHVLGAGGHILLWCYLAQQARAKFTYSFRMRWWWFLAPLCVLAAWFSRGWLDDLSITTLALMAFALRRVSVNSRPAPALVATSQSPLAGSVEPSPPTSPAATKRTASLAACVVCVISGTFLYLATLGLLPWSIYQAGPGLVPVFLSTSLLALFACPLVGRAMILALLAYALRLGFSDNPWDYLMDPLLWFYSFYRLWRLARNR